MENQLVNKWKINGKTKGKSNAKQMPINGKTKEKQRKQQGKRKWKTYGKQRKNKGKQKQNIQNFAALFLAGVQNFDGGGLFEMKDKFGQGQNFLKKRCVLTNVTHRRTV